MLAFILGLVLAFIAAAVVGLIVFFFPLVLYWFNQRGFRKCRVKFQWEEPVTVGETVSFKIYMDEPYSDPAKRKKAVDSAKSQEFLRDVIVEIRKMMDYQSTTSPRVEYVKELDPETGEIVVKFSVRRAGLYMIAVAYHGATAIGSPFRKRFKPSVVEASKTVFLRPSPTLLCITANENTHKIQPRDVYGNDCTEGYDLEKFDFKARLAENEDDDNLAEDQQIVSHILVIAADGRIEMILCVQKPGVYKGKILYEGKPITNGQFDILCVTRKEHSDILETAGNNPAWTPHAAEVAAIGDHAEQRQRKAYLYVSPKLLYVQEYFFKIVPIKIATYRVSSVTKMRMILSQNFGTMSYTFLIMDGIQPKVTVRMKASEARVMLGLYVYFLQKRIGGAENFEGKQRVFYQELRATMRDLRMTSKIISVTRASLVHSSISATKYFRKSDWCKNFGIQYENEPGYDYGGLRREWLELLSTQFFQDSKFGMFSSIGTSRLVHPTPSSIRYPCWQLKHYEFAGKIVGKCLFESACGDTYKQMVNAKFTRSFLAQILGIPPNYQNFEQDDPELFVSKIKYILENDVSDMDLTFSEEEYDANGRLVKIVELIPNGGKRPVTADNKEQYLNALAQYRLCSKVTKEIEAFKKGLFEIVTEELFSNFDENELELLMCGRSEFNIEDLRENAVRDWSWGPTPTKLYNWFFTAVANMSDDERARLLQFTTGSSLLPHGGFAALNPKFKISITSDRGKLPKAHTCFNTICLSDHDSYEQFERALRLAITEGAEGFAFT